MPLPSGVQTEQILKAVKALLKHIEKQKAKANELIEEDVLIYLVRDLTLFKPPLLWTFSRNGAQDSCAGILNCLWWLQQVSLKKTPEHTKKDKPLRM